MRKVPHGYMSYVQDDLSSRTDCILSQMETSNPLVVKKTIYGQVVLRSHSLHPCHCQQRLAQHTRNLLFKISGYFKYRSLGDYARKYSAIF